MATPPRFPTKPPGPLGERASAARGRDYATKDSVIEAIDTLGRAIDGRFATVDHRLANLEKGQEALETRLDRVETRLDRVETRLTNLEVGQESIVRVMNENHAELNRKIELILTAITPQPR
ncbi:hypothetical protein [Azospirillum rugosum]|uniref:Archaellum component FlaC n=1 Tax=Azospirillum rugosum TaxID=416170 RepID=A0ABS4SH03_9PROT|nr:hypothetical protein [Azospirillum rugosum]MBP2291856.1 archaellum component FlaC [Azospirillum rugosum]MDQ0524332.1 archaellum component FlaC [Azospirillum rugosum]